MAQKNTKDLVIDLDEDVYAVGTDNVVDEDAPIAVSGDDDGVVDEDIDPLDKLPKRAVRNADGSITLPLYYPHKVGAKKDGKVRWTLYDRLTFHRLNGADQRAIAAVADKDMTVVSFARSTRINQAVMNALFDLLDIADINDCGQVLNHFLSSGPKTGR